MGQRDLERAARQDLRTLTKENAEGVAGHLVMVGRLLDTDIELARAHADAAVRRAGRVPAVREARGVVAYHEGDWAVALSELRTARRLSGSDHVVALIADSERALGRLDRALDLVTSVDATKLHTDERIELAIVLSGIRRELGQPDAARAALQVPELVAGRSEPWAARLYYAYAETLLEAGDSQSARDWFAHAVAADQALLTDAAERIDELDGVLDVDLLADEEDEEDVPDGDEEHEGEEHEGEEHENEEHAEGHSTAATTVAKADTAADGLDDAQVPVEASSEVPTEVNAAGQDDPTEQPGLAPSVGEDHPDAQEQV